VDQPEQQTPLISVIVPARNVATYIEEALSSLESQTFRDFEVLVIDDGSTDGTREIIEGFCAAHARFTAIPGEGHGVSAARNAGLAAARGEYVAFLDGDDRYVPDALELLHERMTETHADLVIGNYLIFDDVHSWHVPDMRSLLEQPEYGPLDPALLSCYVIWNKLYRREIIEAAALRFPPYVFAQDSVFAMRYAFLSRTIVTLDADVCHYRRRSLFGELSATQVISLRSERDHLATHADIRSSAEERWNAELATAEPAELPLLERKRAEYLDRLGAKEVERLVSARYANLWYAEEGVAELISARVAELRDSISYAVWRGLASSHADLCLTRLPRSRAEAAREPILSVIVWDDGRSSESLDATMHSIYAQRFPLFEVVVAESTARDLKPEVREFANLRVIDAPNRAALIATALESTSAEYVLFAEPGVVYRITAFRRMWKRLSRGNCDAVSCPVAHVDEGEDPRVIAAHRVAFYDPVPVRGGVDESRTKLDRMLANKLIRRSYLQLSGFSASSTPGHDAEELYRNAYVLLAPRERLMYTAASEDEFTAAFLGIDRGKLPWGFRRRLARADAAELERGGAR